MGSNPSTTQGCWGTRVLHQLETITSGKASIRFIEQTKDALFNHLTETGYYREGGGEKGVNSTNSNKVHIHSFYKMTNPAADRA